MGAVRLCSTSVVSNMTYKEQFPIVRNSLLSKPQVSLSLP